MLALFDIVTKVLFDNHYKFKACKNEERLYIQFLWIFIVYILSLVSLDRKSTIDRQVIDTCIDNWKAIYRCSDNR